MEIISKSVFINKEYIVLFEEKRYKILLDNTSTEFPPGHHGNYIVELELEDDVWTEGRSIDEIDDEAEFDYIWNHFIEAIDIDEMLPEPTLNGFIDWIQKGISDEAIKQKQADDELREKGYALPETSVPIAILDMIRQYMVDKHIEYCKLTGLKVD